MPSLASRLLFAGFAFGALPSLQAASPFHEAPPSGLPDGGVGAFDVVFESPSAGSSGSLPSGNGDIGINAWIEKSGDLLFYISKTDAWDARGELVKLGRARVSLSPALKPDARIRLSLKDSSIRVSDGSSSLRLWVDANNPCVWLESVSSSPSELSVSAELWRTHAQGASLGREDAVVCYQRNGRATANVPKWGSDVLSGRCFGFAVSGEGLVAKSPLELKRAKPAKSHLARFAIHCSQPKEEAEFVKELDALSSRLAALEPKEAWNAHAAWQAAFWSRSWIRVSSESDPAGAASVERAYALQRYVSACAGRGAFPIKFNGSIFTMDIGLSGNGKLDPYTADERRWEGFYWFQNTRLSYWPMLASGDLDMMRPLFKMYAGLTPQLEARSREKYKRPGAEFLETVSVCASDKRLSAHIERDWNGCLELLSLLLDYYSFSKDESCLDEWLLPMAGSYLDFFDGHFKREDGRLLLTPSHALETYWDLTDPAPDVAGLRWVLQGLLRLPESKLAPELKTKWSRLLAETPELPLTNEDWAAPYREKFPFPKGAVKGAKCVAPARILRDKAPNNSENPELYAVFPYRFYGVGKEGLEIGRESFERRLFRNSECWYQDEIQAAFLGLAKAASDGLRKRAKGSDPQCRFPAFWGPGHDYTPDQDHGGVLMAALQAMLVQCDDGRLKLLPAWPKAWGFDFRLHTPEGPVEGICKPGGEPKFKLPPSKAGSAPLLCEPQ